MAVVVHLTSSKTAEAEQLLDRLAGEYPVSADRGSDRIWTVEVDAETGPEAFDRLEQALNGLDPDWGRHLRLGAEADSG